MAETVRINTHDAYDVHIGSKLLCDVGKLVRNAAAGASGALIVTDSNVAPLYLEKVAASLESTGLDVCSFVFPAGESSKNFKTLSDILEFAAKSHLTRRDCMIALGGGVTGDLTGFAAGCYMRGIKYVQIPTSLLAAVDSSVGGKTAVDLKAGKNLAGLFCQPALVVCDTDTLSTLPDDILACGAAEAVKTGMLAGEELFTLLEAGNIIENAGEIIRRCVEFKGKTVEADEREEGLRKILNLGHTPAHAIEKLSSFTVPHGYAVAQGLMIMARAASELGYADRELAKRVRRALEGCGLPVSCAFCAKDMAAQALYDKKRTNDSITLVMPTGIGSVRLVETKLSELERIYRKGTEEA